MKSIYQECKNIQPEKKILERICTQKFLKLLCLEFKCMIICVLEFGNSFPNITFYLELKPCANIKERTYYLIE